MSSLDVSDALSLICRCESRCVGTQPRRGKTPLPGGEDRPIKASVTHKTSPASFIISTVRCSGSPCRRGREWSGGSIAYAVDLRGAHFCICR